MRRRLYADDEYNRINNYFPPDPPLPWSWLDDAKKRFIKPISDGYAKILRTDGCLETTCTDYLADYAGFFLCNPFASFFALREIRLGSDYIVDLAIPYDRFSLGLHYNLIEVEPHHSAPFKKNGDKSTRLNHAIDQVENWRRWLNRHARMARDLFPHWIKLDNEPRFAFTIIIGTRQNTKAWLQRRNEISEEYRISIRSHDWLLDSLGERSFLMNDEPSIGGAEERSVSPIIKNALGNPFFKAWGDVEWKRIRHEMAATGHFFVWNADTIIRNRTYNPLYEKFARYCARRMQNFPEDIKTLHRYWTLSVPIRAHVWC